MLPSSPHSIPTPPGSPQLRKCRPCEGSYQPLPPVARTPKLIPRSFSPFELPLDEGVVAAMQRAKAETALTVTSSESIRRMERAAEVVVDGEVRAGLVDENMDSVG